MKGNNYIKQRRLQLGLTLEEVAEKVGVSKTTIQRYESGIIANMKRDKIELLAKALEVSPAFILGFENYNCDVNNSTIGNNNNNNHIIPAKELKPLEEAILTICRNLSESQQGKVLSFATSLLSQKEDK